VRRFRRYIEESYSELRKVSWPTPEHTRNLTILVFIVSLAVGAYVSVLDVFFQNVVGLLTESLQ
jgi:preprotein translocase SecE subunit